MSRIASLVALLSLSLAAASGANIFVTSTGDAVQDQVLRLKLESFGHTVFIGGQHQLLPVTQKFDGFDAVLLIMNHNWTLDMPVAVQMELLKYIANGGTLVTGEFAVRAHRSLQELNELFVAIPVVSSSMHNSMSPITYTATRSDAALGAGLNSFFTFNADVIDGVSETFFAPKPGATVYYQSSLTGAGLIAWAFGAGRVISFSTVIGPLELADESFSRLLSNTFSFLAPSIRGDMNCDQRVNFNDIDAFVLALTDPLAFAEANPGCNMLNGDINGDGLVNFADINVFVKLIETTGFPPGHNPIDKRALHGVQVEQQQLPQTPSQ